MPDGLEERLSPHDFPVLDPLGEPRDSRLPGQSLDHIWPNSPP